MDSSRARFFPGERVDEHLYLRLGNLEVNGPLIRPLAQPVTGGRERSGTCPRMLVESFTLRP